MDRVSSCVAAIVRNSAISLSVLFFSFGKFNDQYRPLPALLSYADQGGALDLGMFIENSFARNRIHDPLFRPDPMGLAPAEPYPAAIVQVAHVSHPVPETRPVPYLGHHVFAVVMIIGPVTTGPLTTISPISPAGSCRTSFHDGIGPSPAG
jgi:hypothetical protein